MAKGGSTGKSDDEAKVTAPAIAEALRNVRVTTAEDDPTEAAKATQQAEQQSEAEQQAAAAIDTQNLIGQGVPGLEDHAAEAGTDSDTGTGLDSGALGSLGDRLGNVEQLQRLADQLGSADAPVGDQAPSGHDSSMFAAGGDPLPLEELSREGITAPGAPVAERTGEEVDKVVAGDKNQTREGVTSIPFLGGKVDDALTNAEHAAGTHAGQLNQAANSDPTVNTGSGSGSTSGSTSGSQPGSSDSGSGGTGGTGGTQGSGDGSSLVSDEFDNDDGSHTTVYDSGDIVTTYPDGTVEHNYPDGTVETDYPDGTLKTENPDGSTETIHPDGTVETTDPTPPPPPDDSGSDDGGTGGSASSGTDATGSASGSGTSGSGTEGSGAGSSAQAGTDGGGGDPGDPDSGAPLPSFIQQQVDAGLAGARAELRPFTPGDGATDPNPDAGEPIDRSGPIQDTKGVLLGGDTGGPGSPEFGAGSHGSDVGSLAGSLGGLNPENSDPGPESDTGVQTSGPSERTVQQPTPSLEAAPTAPADSSDDASSDDGSDAPLSPMHEFLQPPSLAEHLAVVGADDTTDDSSDDDNG
jgi:hypothetical protein